MAPSGELELPTGDSGKGIGSSHVLEVVPFVDFGWNLSFLYHFGPYLGTLLEFDGRRIFGGEMNNQAIVNFSPGIKVSPLGDESLKIGGAVSVPVSNDREIKTRAIFSIFYHFQAEARLRRFVSS